jgi:hypothetical protein
VTTPNPKVHRSRPTRRGLLVVAALLVGSGGLVGCSTSGSSAASPPDLSEEQLTDWLGIASEVVGPCHESVQLADVAFDEFVASGLDEELILPAMMAAGQAVEQCVIDDDEATALDGLRETFPQGAALLAEWMTATEVTARELLVVAAGNFDSRRLVGELFEQMRIDDDLGTRINELAIEVGEGAGLDASSYVLHRWDPPDH